MFVLSNLVFSSFCISVLLFILHIVHDSITKKINSHFRLIIITTNRPIKLFLWMPAGIGKGGGALALTPGNVVKCFLCYKCCLKSQ